MAPQRHLGLDFGLYQRHLLSHGWSHLDHFQHGYSFLARHSKCVRGLDRQPCQVG